MPLTAYHIFFITSTHNMYHPRKDTEEMDKNREKEEAAAKSFLPFFPVFSYDLTDL